MRTAWKRLFKCYLTAYIYLSGYRAKPFLAAIERQGAVNGRTLRHPDNEHLPQVVLPFREAAKHLVHVLSRIKRVEWIGRDRERKRHEEQPGCW